MNTSSNIDDAINSFLNEKSSSKNDDALKSLIDKFNLNNESKLEFGSRLYDLEFYDEAIPILSKSEYGVDIYRVATVFFYREEYSKAFLKFKESADKGYARAFYWLGYMSEYGLGCDKSATSAELYYTEGLRNKYVLPHRSLIRLKYKGKNIVYRAIYYSKLFCITVNVIYIAFKNPDDERLADVPNIWNKK